jgi:hypothetical protein
MFKNKMHGMYFWNKSHNQVLPVVTLCSSSDRIDRKEINQSEANGHVGLLTNRTDDRERSVVRNRHR